MKVFDSKSKIFQNTKWPFSFFLMQQNIANESEKVSLRGSVHEAAWYIISVACVCLSACLSVCRELSKTLTYRKFIFAYPVYLERIRFKFVYEGHRLKVKVTGAKKVENPYFRNVKLRSAIIPVE